MAPREFQDLGGARPRRAGRELARRNLWRPAGQGACLIAPPSSPVVISYARGAGRAVPIPPTRQAGRRASERVARSPPSSCSNCDLRPIRCELDGAASCDLFRPSCFGVAPKRRGESARRLGARLIECLHGARCRPDPDCRRIKSSTAGRLDCHSAGEHLSRRPPWPLGLRARPRAGGGHSSVRHERICWRR